VQPLTADPRTAYTPAQITSLLTAPDLAVDYGVELLTPALALVADISADVASWVVRHDNLANVHTTIDLSISRQLAWGYDRVRPYALYSSATAGVSKVRFNEGVFMLQTPAIPLAESPATFTVTGYDQLHLLQNGIGDSYSVAAGSNVLAAVRAALTSAGIVAPVLLDSSASAAVLASDLVFPLTSSSSPTWLQVVNDLLASIYYWGVWVDWDGAFRSSPYLQPVSRPSEWLYTVGDLTTGVVASERSAVQDLWGVPNWMRFIRNGLPSAPTEGAGQYTVQNASTGVSSQASVGRVVRAPVAFLDAVDQASLVSQGDAIFAAARRNAEVITAKVSPMPIFWHQDTATWSDAALGADRKCAARSWALFSDGSDGDLILESVV
jgi:hypothetical protein